MMLKILKCLKEGMREKINVRMPPHTSAQYLHSRPSLTSNTGAPSACFLFSSMLLYMKGCAD